MKKKLGDVTLGEAAAICAERGCSECPFKDLKRGCFVYHVDKELDKEIEVDKQNEAEMEIEVKE